MQPTIAPHHDRQHQAQPFKWLSREAKPDRKCIIATEGV